MSFTDKYTKVFKYLLPAPFTIAISLTVITFLIAFFSTRPDTESFSEYSIQLLKYWEEGLWNSGLLVFAIQMMLMLVLGHVLALTKPVNYIISLAVKSCNNTAKAAALITLLTVMVSLFNWGLGLIFGAIFARKVAEHATQLKLKINYPIIGAAGYSGLMVWHGGLSGSSLAKIAEPGHLKEMMVGILPEEQILALPETISYSETVFSDMNIFVTALLLVILPLAMYWMGKRTINTLQNVSDNEVKETLSKIEGAEKLDHSALFSWFFGGVILFYVGYKIAIDYNFGLWNFFTPNNINLLLLSLAIILHKSFYNFIKAIDKAIGGASGILIQFPLYFGIMGIMKSSGLVTDISAFFVQISNETTYPIFTFLSAGLVNIFVPSGGGQWAVQGPIIVQAANELGISLPKSIMALAYGDQLTNMLQPFWALPLLGITGLKAKEILPYTLFLMIIGTVIYLTGLLIF
ncbi:MAG: short-chain fatty acid transporter [Flavobacteriales bacterium]|nr:MAG: short-chain fatty acid transporter [Flavobacteriales bacterium]